MRVPLSEILHDARRKGYGVPALAVENELNLRSAIEAAEQARSPLILLSGYAATRDLTFFVQTLNHYCDGAKVPAAVILDHASSYEKCAQGVRSGFGAVMYDCSKLPFEENSRRVAEVVRFAHACGVEVEAELGHVGGREYETQQETESVFTEIGEARAFVEQTGVDFLAVAVGTAHGIYKGTPKLDFGLLEALREAVPVPLVLHGASGTGDENISRACKLGACKVNVGTELYLAGRDAVKQADLDGANVYSLYQQQHESYMRTALHWFRVCGSEHTV